MKQDTITLLSFMVTTALAYYFTLRAERSFKEKRPLAGWLWLLDIVAIFASYSLVTWARYHTQ